MRILVRTVDKLQPMSAWWFGECVTCVSCSWVAALLGRRECDRDNGFDKVGEDRRDPDKLVVLMMVAPCFPLWGSEDCGGPIPHQNIVVKTSCWLRCKSWVYHRKLCDTAVLLPLWASSLDSRVGSVPTVLWVRPLIGSRLFASSFLNCSCTALTQWLLSARVTF